MGIGHLKDLEKHGQHLKKLASFFDPLHRAIAFKPLTDFKWLTKDHLIQQITFGDSIVLTANFSEKLFETIPAHTLQVKNLDENTVEMYTITE